MTYEDFANDYTEYDPQTDLTTPTNTKIYCYDFAKNSSSKIYKDFGVDHFYLFKHDFTINYEDRGISSSVIVGFGMLSNVNDGTMPKSFGWLSTDHKDECMLCALTSSGGKKVTLYSVNAGVVTEESVVGIDTDTDYYITMMRFNPETFWLGVYNDEDRTDLRGSLTSTVTQTRFRYLCGALTHDKSTGGDTFWGYVENMQLYSLDECMFSICSEDDEYVFMTMPNDVSTQYSKDVKIHHLWNNTEKAIDTGISTDNIVLSGSMTNTGGFDVYNIASQIISFMDNGKSITLSGFDTNIIDDEWIIENFSYNVTGGVKNTIDYELALERKY